MSDVKKYYYMRLKESFFDDDSMKILEAMPDGYLYSNILLKLYLRSLKYEGRLMLSKTIPYSAEMISAIVNHPVGVVQKAIQIFQQLGLIEILDNGAIYMLDIQNFIGQASTEADRQREYDRKISAEKKSPRNLEEIRKKFTPKIEIEKDIKLEKEKKTEKEINTICSEPSGKTEDFEPEAAVAAIPLNTGAEWRPKISDYESFCKLYPGVDVEKEINKMAAWCMSNPTKRKTQKGIMRFVNNWLSKAQDSSSRGGYLNRIDNRVSVVDTWE